jgi:hypothetical protein
MKERLLKGIAFSAPFLAALGFSLALWAGGGQELIGVEIEMPKSSATGHMMAVEVFAFTERGSVREALVPSTLVIGMDRCNIHVEPLARPVPTWAPLDAATFELPSPCDEPPRISVVLNGAHLGSSTLTSLSDGAAIGAWSPLMKAAKHDEGLDVVAEQLPMPLEAWTNLWVRLPKGSGGLEVEPEPGVEAQKPEPACGYFKVPVKPTFPVTGLRLKTVPSAPKDPAPIEANGATHKEWFGALPTRGSSMRGAISSAGLPEVTAVKTTAGVDGVEPKTAFIALEHRGSRVYEARVNQGQPVQLPLLADGTYSLFVAPDPFARADAAVVSQQLLYWPRKTGCDLATSLFALAENAGNTANAEGAPKKLPSRGMRMLLSNEAKVRAIQLRARKLAIGSLALGILAEVFALTLLVKLRKRKDEQDLGMAVTGSSTMVESQGMLYAAVGLLLGVLGFATMAAMLFVETKK